MPREIISLYWHDHPEKTKAWYEGEKDRLSMDALAREVDLNYELSALGVVFQEFQDAHILRGDYKVDPNLKVIRTLDYGKTCAAVFAQKDTFGNITFFHEIVFIQQTDPTRKLARAVQTYSDDLRCVGFADHDDPAGVTDNYVNENETSFKIVQQYGIRPTHHVSGASSSRRRNRVELAKFKLSEFPGGVPVVRVHESCTYLIDALRSGYRYQIDSKTKQILEEILEEHPHEDLADVFGITLMEEFDIKKEVQVPKRIPQRGNRYTGYR